MNWLESLLWDPSSVAHIVCLYAFVISVGVLLGKIKIFGVSFGGYIRPLCRYPDGPFWLHGRNTHFAFHPRIRFDFICILYRSASRALLLLFL